MSHLLTKKRGFNPEVFLDDDEDDEDEESIYEPLLNGTDDNNKRKACIKCLGFLYCLGVTVFSLIAIISIIDLFQPSEPILINDISIIPNQYHLKQIGGLCSRCDYVINSLFVDENKILHGKRNDNESSSIVASSSSSSSSPPSITLAKLTSTSEWYNILSRKYSIHEFHFNDTLNATNEVSTAFTTYNWWYGNIKIRFPAAIDTATIPKDEEDDDDDEDDMLKQSCVYKISITTFLHEGSIFKKCENDGDLEFYKISSVTGDVKIGLEFLSPNKSIAYAKTTRTNSKFSSTPERNVTINQNTPFPNILAAIYTVYHDLAVSSRS